MNNKKILFVASSAPTHESDSTAPFILNMAKDLSDLGWKTDILAPHAPGLAREEIIDGVKIYRFKYFFEQQQKLCYRGGVAANLNSSKFVYLLIPFFLISEFVAVLSLTAKNNYKIIHSHWLIPQGVICTLCCKLLKTIHVASIHGGDVYTFNGGFAKLLKKYSINNTKNIIANSFATKKIVEHIALPQKLHVIPTGTTPPDDTKNINNRNKDDSITTVIFLGRIAQEKGLPYLLKAVKLTWQTHRVQLKVLGAGPELDDCKQLTSQLDIEAHVEFVGAIPHKDIYKHLSKADIFVGPSISMPSGSQEAQGNTFIEAMFAKLPVIASNIGGIPDAVIHGETGILVDEKSPESISAAIIELIEDPKLMKKIAQKGYEHACKNYSRYDTANKISGIYTELTS